MIWTKCVFIFELNLYLKEHRLKKQKLPLCFLNLWLSKALNRCQKSIIIVKFRHFLCLYMIYIEKKVVPKMYVCVSVCLFVCLSVGCQFYVRELGTEISQNRSNSF